MSHEGGMCHHVHPEIQHEQPEGHPPPRRNGPFACRFGTEWTDVVRSRDCSHRRTHPHRHADSGASAQGQSREGKAVGMAPAAVHPPGSLGQRHRVGGRASLLDEALSASAGQCPSGNRGWILRLAAGRIGHLPGLLTFFGPRYRRCCDRRGSRSIPIRLLTDGGNRFPECRFSFRERSPWGWLECRWADDPPQPCCGGSSVPCPYSAHLR